MKYLIMAMMAFVVGCGSSEEQTPEVVLVSQPTDQDPTSYVPRYTPGDCVADPSGRAYFKIVEVKWGYYSLVRCDKECPIKPKQIYCTPAEAMDRTYSAAVCPTHSHKH